MLPMPSQRLSSDRRRAVLPDAAEVREHMLVARAAGWRLLVAQVLPDGVHVVFARSGPG